MKEQALLFVLVLVMTSTFVTRNGDATITPSQMGMYDFRVKQGLTPDEMNGIVDVTTKLQAAVNASRDARQTLFLNSGTYLVSAQIYCEMTHDNSNDRNNYPDMPVNIVGSALNRPTILLADSTPAFNGPHPLAVFHYETDRTLVHPRRKTHYNSGWVMQGGIRGINIDLGRGNTKAVGLYWSTAQYCYIEDLDITVRDGFAGMTGIGGANCLTANIDVKGGKYGFYLPNSSEAEAWGMSGAPQNTITGCRFTDQSVAALHLHGWGGITIVGSSIVQTSGTAIDMNAGSMVEIFPLSLVDCKIEFTTHDEPNTVLSNRGQGPVTIRGLYARGAATISDNGGDGDLGNSGAVGDWTEVRRYNYVSKIPKTNRKGATMLAMHYDAVTGTQSDADIIELTTVAEPPVDLLSQHIWSTTPSFEDPDAFLITSTTAAGIQAAIDAHDKVCLPKGTYPLEKPITLRANTTFIGCPGRGRSGAVLKYGWAPTVPSWLIETENSATAAPYLLDVTTRAGTEDYRGSVHWRAGEDSILRDLWCDMGWIPFEQNYTRLFFSGNGGGRVFSYQDEKGMKPGDSAYRKVKISGTSQQLTFYGLCLERGGSEYPVSTFPMLEIENASNIRIFGAKSETSQPYAAIHNSRNIFITNVIDFVHFGSYEQNYFEITGTGSDRIEITNSIYYDPPDSSYRVVADPWNTNEVPRTMVLGCYHRNWSSF